MHFSSDVLLHCCMGRLADMPEIGSGICRLVKRVGRSVERKVGVKGKDA